MFRGLCSWAQCAQKSQSHVVVCGPHRSPPSACQGEVHDHSADALKAFDKIHHPFPIKTLSKVGKEGPHLNLTKASCGRCAANIAENGGNLKRVPENRCRMRLCPGHNAIAESWLQPSDEGKERLPDGKGDIKLSLFAGDVILYTENPKESTKNTVIMD